MVMGRNDPKFACEIDRLNVEVFEIDISGSVYHLIQTLFKNQLKERYKTPPSLHNNPSEFQLSYFKITPRFPVPLFVIGRECFHACGGYP